MHYIFVSSNNILIDERMETLQHIKKEDLLFCSFEQPYLSEFCYTSKNRSRRLDCYSFEKELNAFQSDDVANIFHGYLLNNTSLETNGGKELNPKECYYGVYSHGFVSATDCYFASDEVGLSPIYYSQREDYLFISNNPHLIAIYQLKLGFKVAPEPTLPIWHTTGITVESDITGYENIKRVRPWRYITVDFQNVINFPVKSPMSLPVSYEDSIDYCIEELRTGMQTIQNRFSLINEVQLTGGFDSRLVLAFLLEAELQNKYTFETHGVEEHPDLIVAKMLCESLGINHKVESALPLDITMDVLEQEVKNKCIATAMESTTIRFFNEVFLVKKYNPKLGGLGATMAKSMQYPESFIAFMKRRFKGQDIDFNNLTGEHLKHAHECIGYSDVDRLYLTDLSFENSNNYRKYIIEFGLNNFPENMYYVDCMIAYRYRNHESGLEGLHNRYIYLYSPAFNETVRKLSPSLRQNSKLHFDIMQKIYPSLCLIPFENRKYDPELYAHLPNSLKEQLSLIPKITGSPISQTQDNAYNFLVPTLRKNLLDMIPKNVFDYIKKDSLEKRLTEDIPFGKEAFLHINLFGLSKWYEIVADLNRNYSK